MTNILFSIFADIKKSKNIFALSPRLNMGCLNHEAGSAADGTLASIAMTTVTNGEVMTAETTASVVR